MEIVNANYMPGDQRLIDHIVYELKSQGIFDNFRKECIADVDTKPAYQNLRQRVEGSVSGFLKTQKWRPDMNKNFVREMLRKNISESGFLETGVERIVDQVVNPKINTVFLPQVENIVYKVLGIQKPSVFDDLKTSKIEATSVLPNDLEMVSRESSPKLNTTGNENVEKSLNKADEDESPPFEPLEETSSFIVQEENSIDSHLSGFSGLASHDSNHSFEAAPKSVQMEISNQESSKQSSDDHLSIVTFEEKLENSEDSNNTKLSKTTDSTKSFDFMSDKIESKKAHDKKHEKHRSSDSKHRSSKDQRSERDKRSDRDRKDKDRHHKRSSRDSKDPKDRKDSKDGKDKGGSSSRHRQKTDTKKEDKTKDESKSSKTSESRTKESVKSRSDSRSSRSESKGHSKHNGKTKISEGDRKHQKSDKTSSKDGKRDKDKRDAKRTKDDHYGLKTKNSERRSTDRDSSDGNSGTQSSSSSFLDSAASQLQKASQESSQIASSGDSNSDQVENTEAETNFVAESLSQFHEIPSVKLIKPKFASNIFEARRLMKIRKKLGKIEKQRQFRLVQSKIPEKASVLSTAKQSALSTGNESVLSTAKDSVSSTAQESVVSNAQESVVSTAQESVLSTAKESVLSTANESPANARKLPNILKKQTKFKRKNNLIADAAFVKEAEKKVVVVESDEEVVAEVVEVSDIPLENSVISKESWDAIEAKHLENMTKINCISYVDLSESKISEQKTEAAPNNNNNHDNKAVADCLYLSANESDETQSYFDVIYLLMSRLEENITRREVLLKFAHNRRESDDEMAANRKLPKIAIVDIDGDNEITISPNQREGHNNNNNNRLKKRKIEEDDLEEESLDLAVDSNVLKDAKRAKVVDSTVNHLDSFNLPLSPAESDKSFTTERKLEKTEIRRSSNGRKGYGTNSNNQRYSNDDLYKPRLQFTRSGRRFGKDKKSN